MTAASRLNRRRASFARQVRKHSKAIARERDKLRDLIANVSEICGDADDAVDDLERAADALSRQL